jgi:hypothetical protein
MRLLLFARDNLRGQTGTGVCEFQLEAMKMQNGGHDTQSQATALSAYIVRTAIESPQDCISFLFGDAWSIILHFYDRGVAFLPGRYGRVSSSKLYGVVHKIAQSLEQQAPIGMYVQIFHIADPKVDAGIFCQRLVEIEDILYQGRQ